MTLSPIYIDEILLDDGILSQKLENYNFRVSQLEMSKLVCKHISSNQNLAIEVPVGGGKSFSYLLPAIKHATSTNSPVVVATKSKLLQEQLINKDLPFLKEILKDQIKFTYSLVKGRNNYICNKKVEYANTGGKFSKGICSDDEREQFNQLYEWYSTTESGDLNELEFNLLPKLREETTITDNECTGRKCAFYDQCYSCLAREKAKSVNIIVVNYHILFLDLMIKAESEGKKSILPRFSTLILDEAHSLVEIARDFLGYEINRFSLNRSISNFIEIYKSLTKEKVIKKNQSERIDGYVFEWRKFRDEWAEILAKYAQSKDYNKLLTRENESTLKYPTHLVEYTDFILNEISNIQTVVEGLVLENDEHTNPTLIDKLELLSRIDEAFSEYKHNLDSVLFGKLVHSDEWKTCNFCAAINLDKKKEYGSVSIIPIVISNYLKDIVFKQMKSTIATSATLRAGRDFSFFINSSGFYGNTKALPSEFDLKNQMRITVDRRMPNPSDLFNDKQKYEKYMEVLAHNANVIINERKGGTLILATSIKQTMELKERLEKLSDYPILCQYDNMPQYKIIEEFKNDRNACLIGADSYWAGLDVPGETLNSIIICKLPFKHIDDPIALIMNKRNQNSFMNYVLPLAIIAFVQGIGRLIRNEKDSGLVYIADPRIATKQYGANFLTFFTENNVPIRYL